jgi:hypothetical protein
MTRNHPELVQILEIFIYSENTRILPIESEEQGGPDKDLFLPVDILQK